MLAQLCSRVGPARVDEWWLATSSHPEDDVTEAWGFDLGLRVFRGDPTYVLSRFLAIARETRAEWLVRVTAENPFLDAPLVDSLLDARDESEDAKVCDLIRHRQGTPLGHGIELVRRTALERADREIPASEPHHRVHVTSWLSNHALVHEVANPPGWPERPDWRWTVDTYEDLAMARSAFRVFGREAETIGYPEMVERLDAHPEIPAMNAHIEQKKLEEG